MPTQPKNPGDAVSGAVENAAYWLGRRRAAAGDDRTRFYETMGHWLDTVRQELNATASSFEREVSGFGCGEDTHGRVTDALSSIAERLQAVQAQLPVRGGGPAGGGSALEPRAAGASAGEACDASVDGSAAPRPVQKRSRGGKPTWAKRADSPFADKLRDDVRSVTQRLREERLARAREAAEERALYLENLRAQVRKMQGRDGEADRRGAGPVEAVRAGAAAGRLDAGPSGEEGLSATGGHDDGSGRGVSRAGVPVEAAAKAASERAAAGALPAHGRRWCDKGAPLPADELGVFAGPSTNGPRVEHLSVVGPPAASEQPTIRRRGVSAGPGASVECCAEDRVDATSAVQGDASPEAAGPIGFSSDRGDGGAGGDVASGACETAAGDAQEVRDPAGSAGAASVPPPAFRRVDLPEPRVAAAEPAVAADGVGERASDGAACGADDGAGLGIRFRRTDALESAALNAGVGGGDGAIRFRRIG